VVTPWEFWEIAHQAFPTNSVVHPETHCPLHSKGKTQELAKTPLPAVSARQDPEEEEDVTTPEFEPVETEVDLPELLEPELTILEEKVPEESEEPE
jgi:hypothetical protein